MTFAANVILAINYKIHNSYTYEEMITIFIKKAKEIICIRFTDIGGFNCIQDI